MYVAGPCFVFTSLSQLTLPLSAVLGNGRRHDPRHAGRGRRVGGADRGLGFAAAFVSAGADARQYGQPRLAAVPVCVRRGGARARRRRSTSRTRCCSSRSCRCCTRACRCFGRCSGRRCCMARRRGSRCSSRVCECPSGSRRTLESIGDLADPAHADGARQHGRRPQGAQPAAGVRPGRCASHHLVRRGCRRELRARLDRRRARRARAARRDAGGRVQLSVCRAATSATPTTSRASCSSRRCSARSRCRCSCRTRSGSRADPTAEHHAARSSRYNRSDGIATDAGAGRCARAWAQPTRASLLRLQAVLPARRRVGCDRARRLRRRARRRRTAAGRRLGARALACTRDALWLRRGRRRRIPADGGAGLDVVSAPQWPAARSALRAVARSARDAVAVARRASTPWIVLDAAFSLRSQPPSGSSSCVRAITATFNSCCSCCCWLRRTSSSSRATSVG